MSSNRRSSKKDQSIEAKSGWLAQHSEALKTWLSKFKEEEKQLLTHLLEVYEGFKKIQCLSQTLDGVNQALLGRKQTLQLAIDDPLIHGSDQPDGGLRYPDF